MGSCKTGVPITIRKSWQSSCALWDELTSLAQATLEVDHVLVCGSMEGMGAAVFRAAPAA